MRFRLGYRGPLKANGSLSDKHRIRTELAPQIKDLSTREPMKSYADCFGSKPVGNWPYAPRVVDGITFIPVVYEGLFLVARIDILFLRPEDPGRVITRGGDLDNRIKTLFDGLRVPKSGELPKQVNHPEPVWCLLEDDALITEFTVRTDRLLGAGNSEDVLLVITVTVGASRHVIKNLGGIASF
jgi:hypothetical protein